MRTYFAALSTPVLWFAAGAVLAVGGLADAGDAAAQEQRLFRDWTLICDVMAETRRRVCWIYNDATEIVEEHPEPMTVSVSVGFIPEKTPPIVHFHLCPPAAPGGSVLKVSVDDELVSEIPLEFATEAPCQIARSSEDEEEAADMLSAFRRGIVGQFQIVGPDGFETTIPLSLLGLTRALRTLETIHERG